MTDASGNCSYRLTEDCWKTLLHQAVLDQNFARVQELIELWMEQATAPEAGSTSSETSTVICPCCGLRFHPLPAEAGAGSPHTIQGTDGTSWYRLGVASDSKLMPMACGVNPEKALPSETIGSCSAKPIRRP